MKYGEYGKMGPEDQSLKRRSRLNFRKTNERPEQVASFPLSPEAEQLRAPCSPNYKSDGDRTELVEFCGHTVNYIRTIFPEVEMAAVRAMQFAQQELEWRRKPSVEEIYRRYPVFKQEGVNVKDIEELIESKPGSPDAGQWTRFVFARNLQLPADTVMRYKRTRPKP
jgi:hypothetical protein